MYVIGKVESLMCQRVKGVVRVDGDNSHPEGITLGGSIYVGSVYASSPRVSILWMEFDERWRKTVSLRLAWE
jgi:hypothetical protein